MSPQDKRKLERVVKELEGALAVVREILANESSSGGTGSASEFDASAEIDMLKSLDRSAAESRLSELKQQELGAVFAHSGGSSVDRKKPKVWLAEQILWRLFDFERGHEAIRSGRET